MGAYVQFLILTIICIILFWLGYSLFFGSHSPFFNNLFKSFSREKMTKGEPGDPQTCPLCSMKLFKGELVKTIAFPSVTGGADRLMYIRGCFSCLQNNVPRRCPVCGAELGLDDYLVSRMFARSNTRSHVHVLGCNYCRKTGTYIS